MSKYWLKLRCLKGGWVTLSTNFRRKGGRPPTNFGIRKHPGLSCGVVCVILRLAILIQYQHVTHRETDTQTEMRSWLLSALGKM